MPQIDHNAYQRQYYSRPERKPRMEPSRSRYVLRHFHRALQAAGLGESPDESPGGPSAPRVLEVGCGMGRFTRLLLDRGFEVSAVDLSPDLLGRLEAGTDEASLARLRTTCCDAAELHRHVEGRFDAALGFFFLHHLDDLLPTLRSVHAVLRPGARVAFCEPNAFHLPFYLQILVTPGMTWKGDRGIVRMRPGPLRDAVRDAGFVEPQIESYGMVPPAVSNRPAGAALESWLERRRILRNVQAFHVISAASPRE